MSGSSWPSREAAWFGSVVASMQPPWTGCSTSSRGDRPAGRCPCLLGGGPNRPAPRHRRPGRPDPDGAAPGSLQRPSVCFSGPVGTYNQGSDVRYQRLSADAEAPDRGKVHPADGVVTISRAQMSLLIDGLDWRSAKSKPVVKPMFVV